MCPPIANQGCRIVPETLTVHQELVKAARWSQQPLQQSTMCPPDASQGCKTVPETLTATKMLVKAARLSQKPLQQMLDNSVTNIADTDTNKDGLVNREFFSKLIDMAASNSRMYVFRYYFMSTSCFMNPELVLIVRFSLSKLLLKLHCYEQLQSKLKTNLHIL